MMPDYANGVRGSPRPGPRSYVNKTQPIEEEEEGFIYGIPVVTFQVVVIFTMTVIIAGIIIFSPSSRGKDHSAVEGYDSSASTPRTKRPRVGTSRGTGTESPQRLAASASGGWLPGNTDVITAISIDHCHITKGLQGNTAHTENQPYITQYLNGSQYWTNTTKWTYNHLSHNYGPWKVRTDTESSYNHPELWELVDFMDSMSEASREKR